MTHTLTLELQRRGYQVFYLIYNCSITIQHQYPYPAPLTYLPSSELLSEENIQFYHEYLSKHKIDIVINQSGNFDDSRLWVNTGKKKIKVISVLHSNPWVAYKHLWSSDVFPLKNDTRIEYLKRIARIILYPKIKRRFYLSRKNHFKNLLPKTDLVCTLSANYFKELSDICPGYENKYIAIPNPNSYSADLIDNIELIQKKKQILFVGLYGPQKREDRLIKIWRKLYKSYPDWELIMVGDGRKNRVQYLKRLASGIPNIRFEGFQNPLPYYKEAAIFCMTSNYEGWGMVLTEAMQCGTVPIAFNSFAAVTDIIDNGRNGILISPFHIDDYVKQLKRLMDTPALLQTMAKNAQTDIQKYSVEHIADLWEEAFRKAETMI